MYTIISSVCVSVSVSLSVCVCVFIMHTDMWICLSMCIHVQIMGGQVSSSITLCRVSLRHGLSLIQKFTIYASLASQQALHSCMALLPSTRVTGTHSHVWIFLKLNVGVLTAGFHAFTAGALNRW